MGTDLRRLSRCCIGARGFLVPSFPEQVQETVGPLSARYQGTTVEKRQEILQAQLDEDIQKLVDAGHGVEADGFVAGFEVFRPGE